MKPPVLTCSDLSVGYQGHAILSGIDLSLEPGRFISLLGPNGAGKTTLLRTLSRHLEPLGGRIEVMGRPLARLTAMEMARSMAVVLTDKVSPPLFTAFEFAALGRYPHTGFMGRLTTSDMEVVEKALAAVHAIDLAPRPFSDLSDGERQKILVARALAQEPKLLLLDEPTNHLDLKHRIEVMGILRDLCRTRGITVVASLHDLDVAAKVSDRVALVKSGGVSAWGPPEAVLTGSAVSDLYDFNGARFNRRLGGIELRSDGRRGRAFVVAGMGTGALVYRMLAKGGFAIATGVLHTHDLDYHVANALGARCTTLSPENRIDGSALDDAAREMDRCDVVIDCGFDLSTVNRRNMELIHMATGKGKPVLSLRSPGAIPPAVIACENTARLIETLNRRFPVGDKAPRPER